MISYFVISLWQKCRHGKLSKYFTTFKRFCRLGGKNTMELSQQYTYSFKRSCRLGGKTQWNCRNNILTRSKGLAAYAAKAECTKITLGNWLHKIIFVHVVCIALQWKPFGRIYNLS